MNVRDYTLPNGAIVRMNGNIEIRFPGQENWITLARNSSEILDLASVFDRCAEETRHERRGGK